jgi:opacity protein-like surface antigen
MKKLTLVALSAAVILTTVSAASAQVYFGFGPPPYAEPEPYYAPRYYAPPPYYGDAGPRAYGGGYYQRRSYACPNPRWTVQDGVCKPYRGY